MQRFKKELIIAGSTVALRQRYIRMSGMATRGEKFVYGSNGTITQYARWRDWLFVNLQRCVVYRAAWLFAKSQDKERYMGGWREALSRARTDRENCESHNAGWTDFENRVCDLESYHA